MGNNNYTKYDKDFKKSLAALEKWVKQYSTVEVGDGELLTAKKVLRVNRMEMSIKVQSKFTQNF